MVTASAPGKVVLSGEYAVLDGAPAICMSVNRRARVTVVDQPGPEICEVTAPGHTLEVSHFAIRDDGIQWQDDEAPVRVVESVWRASDIDRTTICKINLDSSEFVDPATQQKIGIGSSAAITVALSAAVNQSASVSALTMIAQRAHVALQEGAGSGVDVACSLHGGLIEYRMEGRAVTALNWPQGLLYRLIWSGVTSSTRDKLAKLDAGISKPSRVRLAAVSEEMAAAWQSGDARQVIAAYRNYSKQLQQFSGDHDLGIFGGGHEQLWRSATAAGLTYKPCGAGGGDVGILLGTDDELLDAFSSELPAHAVLSGCQLSTVGVRIEE